ncbi:MAG: hypothetical protein JHD15_23565 [Phenylobacterium sp.]|jgi:hypothetical protein|uniref:DUF6152 family protein n=1 Tax=unclassified Phenylobacterium TaxID=2640670 RepID=UPI0008D60399|nr:MULTISPECIES: DUF6152 family protein [unclassified Phenylobacterium]MBJ7413315.1 hypothetical protein [Phenylobacterium sp.]OHB30314.1 MAG: hypothetical protein A2790_05770 [Phenylobacterium sp. RIFCSPHIGHO2_01_FULL_69_31]
MDKNKKLIVAAAIGAALSVVAAGGAAWAHHAFAAEFDGKAPVLLRGKVTRVEWINPHAWVHMNVVDASGKSTAWMVEGGTPNTLMRSGITKASLPAGTEIIVRGYQSKDKLCRPACKANGRDVTFPDGKKLFMGSSGTGAPKDGSDPTDKK